MASNNCPPSPSTTASDKDDEGHLRELDSRATLSGATGQYLSEELAKWARSTAAGSQRKASRQLEEPNPWELSPWEQVELSVATCYDGRLGHLFSFVYDAVQLSSGRDKCLALVQGYAKFASAALSRPDSERHYMYRGIEDSLSDGRKIFRLFKEFREVYKIRRGFHRFEEGIGEGGLGCIAAVCGFLDICGHASSTFYYFFDNLLWAASVGIVRAKEVPRLQRQMWKGFRKNGLVISGFGGVASVKRKKNLASIWRLNFAIAANLLLLFKAIKASMATGFGFQGPDDARLFHTLELVGMFANYRILLSKLGYSGASHAKMGLLMMLASACGIWSSWRKVRRKNCGAKTFVTNAERRRLGL